MPRRKRNAPVTDDTAAGTSGQVPKAAQLGGATRIVEAPSTTDGTWRDAGVPEPLPARAERT